MSDNLMKEVETLTMVRDNLKEQIKSENIKLSNIQTALREEEIRRESDRKYVELAEKKKEILAEGNVNKKLDELVSKQYALDNEREKFAARQAALHRREQEFVDLEERRKKLNEERNTFNNYKINVLKDLEVAKQIIEEAKVAMDEVSSKEDNLRAREKGLRKKFEDLEQQQAVLNTERRDWEIAKNSELISV